MYRVIVGVFVFLALVLVGVGSQAYAQTCPDFSGIPYTFTQQRIMSCLGSPSSADPTVLNPPSITHESSTGTWVFTQVSPGSCLFTAERSKDQYTEITTYTGVLSSGTKVAMQAVPKPALFAGDFTVPPVVLFGEVTKTDRKTKAPLEIRYQWNFNIGEHYTTNGGHCAATGDGVISRIVP